MIPFASQRALGQDLATHLLNEHDNEYMEVAEVRGAVAQDLHGAFAEWEAQAHALTRCRNYLYSLSVNPHQVQGRLTREQYLDYIERVEEKLGLSGQPRAVVFHIKEDKHGELREHCHVVWSRIDAEQGKAVQLAFDHEKLMMVTRLFARDHGLELPHGYYREHDKDRSKNRQLSLYEKHQQDTSGITKEERIRLVTDAWRRSDSPRAFVGALEELGYMLATGNRPYVLVDLYGNMNALPKMIDDRQVRTKDIRAFLEKEYPPESLPSVDEARALAAQHRKAIEDFGKAQARSDRLDALKRNQAERRQKIEAEQTGMKERQRQATAHLSRHQAGERRTMKAGYLAEARRIREERYRNCPTGLAAFLGRVSGVQLVMTKIQRYRDGKRYKVFLEKKAALRARQGEERLALQRLHEMQALDMDRRIRALDQVDQRERQSLETALQKQRRVEARARAGHTHMPALALELKPPGRRAAPHKAKNRHTSPLREQPAATPVLPSREIDLGEEFGRAAERAGDTDGKQGSGKGTADRTAPRPASEAKVRRRRKRDLDLVSAFNKAAADPESAGGSDDDLPRAREPRPNDHEPRRRRRRRDRDYGRDI